MRVNKFCDGNSQFSLRHEDRLGLRQKMQFYREPGTEETVPFYEYPGCNSFIPVRVYDCFHLFVRWIRHRAHPCPNERYPAFTTDGFDGNARAETQTASGRRNNTLGPQRSRHGEKDRQRAGVCFQQIVLRPTYSPKHEILTAFDKNTAARKSILATVFYG